MKPSTIFPDSLNKAIVFIIALAFIIAMFACGGGGGGDDDTSDNVTISGKVDDGTSSSPISNADCAFYDMNGDRCSQCVADTYGNYSILVEPDNEGYLRCSPPDIPNLALSTFLSTKGLSAGDKSSGENVTPATTIVADIINLEASAVPQARKLELLYDIETEQDPDLQTVVSLSTSLYKSMLQQQLNVQFSDDRGGDGGDGPGDGGGVGGDAGDGADFSPIANARCEFIVSNDLTQGTVLYSAVLADFLDDGILNRPDLQEVKEDLDEILQNYQPEEIQAAFEKVFPGSIGDAYFAITDENGEYFLPVPPSIPGFVRCYPLDQENLVLATYVPEREEDETLTAQDVTPATTVFSHRIATGLSDDLGTVKDNFLDDIAGLGDVHIVETDGVITDFELQGDPADNDVGLVAFSATSLFNILYKNGANIDYLAALDDFVDNESVDSDFLEGQGITPDQAAEWSDTVNSSNEETAQELGSSVGGALSTARIIVTVTDTPEGDGIAGALVTSDLACDGCGTETDAAGQVLLTFTGVSAEATDITVEVSAPGYPLKEETSQIVAFATVDLTVNLYDVMPASFNLTVTKDGSGSGTVTSNPAGIDCGSDCTQDYEEGTQVTLTADPDSDSTFAGWSGDCSGTGGCTLTIDRAHTVTATFTYDSVGYSLTVTKDGSGSGTVTSSPAGINCGSDCTQDYDDGTVVTLTADPDSNSTFDGWSGDPDCADGQVTMDSNIVCTATFTIEIHTLQVTKTGTGSGTVTSSPAGINCGTDCTQDYDDGTVVTLTADPDSDSDFSGWSGDPDCADGQVTMDANITCTATFAIEIHTLDVTKTGTGDGTVTSSPAGINCGTDCAQDYDDGTVVNLTATPNSSSDFTGWSGDPDCSDGQVTMDANIICTATFAIEIHTLQVNKDGSGSGTVSSSPAGINCGTDCAQDYDDGTVVTLTADADSNSDFTGWSGDPDCSDGQVTMDSNITCTATFTYDPPDHKLTVIKYGDGSGTVTSNPAGINCGSDCTQDYEEGTQVTLYHNADSGSYFDWWYGDCYGDGGCMLTMDQDRTVYAYFYENEPGPPYISDIRHDYYGYVDWCVNSSGGTFSGHLYDVYFDYSDPDGNAAASDGAWVTVNGVNWSWADIGGDGYDGTVTLSYCNSSPGVSLYIYMYDGYEERSNQLSINLTED